MEIVGTVIELFASKKINEKIMRKHVILSFIMSYILHL